MTKYLQTKGRNKGSIQTLADNISSKLCSINGWVKLTPQEVSAYNGMSISEKEAYVESRSIAEQSVEKKTADPVIDVKAAENIVPKTDDTEEIAPDKEELESLRKQYLDKFGVEVSNRYKNDTNWIKSKINE